MSTDRYDADVTPRREFLSRLSLAVAGSTLTVARTSRAQATGPAADQPASPLPTIRLGPHQVTRLIVGSNPISGYSYMGPIMDRHMREYFTPERIVEFLTDCERAGIDTHQFGSPEKMAPVCRTLRERGSKMKFLCLHSGDPKAMPVAQVVRETQPIGIVHHGGVTDRLFRQGQSQEVHDFVKRVRDAGVLAGVSAHNPDCIKQVADEGWQVDFFMTCFYYLTRTKEELEKMPPVATLQIGYSFFASDPATMTRVARQVDQPCLGYKILAAGRKCGDKKTVEGAFRFAFENLKPTDGVIVGMYPRYQDQISENATFARQFG
ncbi:MAG: hypothetical protein FJ280_02985 [Planctomycetes bacterium]|nr:hypothetical protein [Planctomycetota bacterium]